MFNSEELNFIKSMLEDEKFRIAIKRQHIENYEDVKKYNEIISDRENFMSDLLIKIYNIKQ